MLLLAGAAAACLLLSLWGGGSAGERDSAPPASFGQEAGGSTDSSGTNPAQSGSSEANPAQTADKNTQESPQPAAADGASSSTADRGEEGDAPKKGMDPAPSPTRLLQCDYYREDEFLRSVAGAKSYDLGGELIAGVVPHHLLASQLIASFFQTAAQGDYETVVFVAPSHYPTSERAVTSLLSWQTPYGICENDAQLTRRLMDSGLRARVDDANMQLDHAVSGLIPYVKYYLPDAQVSAVLLQNRLEPQRAEALAGELLRLSEEKKLLLICSVDFSHYLTPREAAAQDAVTRRALEEMDIPSIQRFSDSNMDSPQSVTVFLEYLMGRGVEEVTFFDHSSADRILGLSQSDPLYQEGVTTYFILGGELS